LAPSLGGVFIATGTVAAATTMGAAWAWGNNRSRQLGYESWGSVGQRPTPAEVLLFISRALVAKHVWQQQPDRFDIATFVHYAGAAPDTVAPSCGLTSTRGWFAQTLWQALSH
jgi:hypothetical protein